MTTDLTNTSSDIPQDYKFVSDKIVQMCLDIARHYHDLALSHVPELKFITDFDKPLLDLGRVASGEIQTTASLDTSIIEATVKMLAYMSKQNCFNGVPDEVRQSAEDLYSSLRSFCISLGKKMPERQLFPEVVEKTTQGMDIHYPTGDIHL